MKVRYKLLGQDCNPVNRSEIYLEVNHDQESIINQVKPHVGINNLYFGREDILKVMAYLNNPPGITEGAPFDIEITESGVTETINMYLNLMDGFKRSNDGIVAAVKMLQSLDWLDERADAFTFESMYNEQGGSSFQIDGITYSSYQNYLDRRAIYVPYVISTIPNFRDAFMALFSTTYILSQIQSTTKLLVQWCTPIAGVFPSISIAQVVLEIVYLALLIAALIALIKHLFDCLLQPIKYHGAMLVVDLLKITAQKMGLTFQSSIWTTYPYNQIAYLPEKFNPIEDQNPGTNTIFGVTFGGFAKRGFTTPGWATSAVHDSTSTTVQKGYFNGTGGDLLRFAKKVCNGKIIIPDQTNNLVLERRDYYPSNTPYQLPAIRQDWNGYNTDELYANIIVRFASDLNDKNCIDKYVGTILQATHQQIIVNNPLLVNLKGLRTIEINAARGIRKGALNFIEQMHKDLYVGFHVIANVGIALANAAILVANALILVINILIAILNLLFIIINAIITTLNAVINVISSFFGWSGGVGNWQGITLVNQVGFINQIAYLPTNPQSYTQRIDALLLENDMVSTPKLLLVDTQRADFTSAGGLGQQRIAYLNNDNSNINNQNVINAQWLWDKFYSIDGFVGNQNNRFTKIAPALNKPNDKNPVSLRLVDFKNLVSNPKFNDNFGEAVISDSIQWYIEKNGSADFNFRKQGWLSNPQSNNGTVRHQEININLQIKTSLPNGQ